MHRGNAAIPFQPNTTPATGLSTDRQAPVPKGRKVAQERSATDPELLRQVVDGGGFATAQTIGQFHQALGARHMVTVSVTICG
jgi:hypothetical protein